MDNINENLSDVGCRVCKKSRQQGNSFTMQCSHVFCLNCLQDCFSNINSNYIECPTCKKLTSLDFFEKELDEFASSTSSSNTQAQGNQIIQEVDYMKPPQYPLPPFQQQQQLSQYSQLSNKPRTGNNLPSEESQRSQQSMKREKLPLKQQQLSEYQMQQSSSSMNVLSDYPYRKQSQDTMKGGIYKSGSIGNNMIQNDPNISNGMFLNSFEISSILPHPNNADTNNFQHFNSPVFNSIQQSYGDPQLVNINNYVNDAQRRSSFSKQDNDEENDFSDQLGDQLIQELPSHTGHNLGAQMANPTNTPKQNEIQMGIGSNSNNNCNQGNNLANNLQNLNGNQINLSKNSESLFSRSNSSGSNLYTLQNNNMHTHTNHNNNSILQNNNHIITQTSTTTNQQSQAANQSFSQSYISPNQQSFVSISGIKCKLHPEEEANLFCFQCNDNCICINCYLTGDHRDHDVKNVRNSFNKLIPLVQNLKERIIIQATDLKSDEELIINRQNDIRSLCSDTLLHLNNQVKEIVSLITKKGEVLAKEIEIFQQEQMIELVKKHDRIRKQLINLTTFSDSYDKILNFQGKCSEARMFNYFSDTKTKVNKYLSKLQKQNEEIRTACRTKYTSCYPEHLFNEIELLIQQIQIPFTVSQPLQIPTTNQTISLHPVIQTPVNQNHQNPNNTLQLFSSSQQQYGNNYQQYSVSQSKRPSQQFEDRSLKESKIIEFDKFQMSAAGSQKNDENNNYYYPTTTFSSSQKYPNNNSALRTKQPREQRMSAGNLQNTNQQNQQGNNSNFFDQNFYQNSNYKANKTPLRDQEPLMERHTMYNDNTMNRVVQRMDMQDQDPEFSSPPQQKQVSQSNPFNLKSANFQFNNQTKNNLVKLKLQEMPFVFPPEIQTSDSFIVHNVSTKNIKTTSRKNLVSSNNENAFEKIPVNSVKDCVQLIKNTLKSRGGSLSQLRDRSQNPPAQQVVITNNEPYRYKSNLKENRYSVPKLDTKKIEQLIMANTLTQKSTERERGSKSNDKKIKELKKILNEGW